MYMKMNCICSAAVFFTASLVLGGGEIRLSEYKSARQPTPPVVIENPNFESGMSGWRGWKNSTTSFQVVDGAGVNGTRALFYERKDGHLYSSYNVCSTRLPLKKGATYNISVMVRCENVKGKDPQGATFCLEARKIVNGKPVYHAKGSLHPKGIMGTSDWKTLEIRNYKMPEDADQVSAGLYLRNGDTGKVWWDELRVTPVDAQWHVWCPTAPMGIASPGAKLEFHFADDSKSVMKYAPAGKLYAFVKLGSQEFSAPIRNDRAEIRLPASFPAGKYTAEVYALDTANKKILNHVTLPLTVSQTGAAIDSHGRIVCDGKPFLPIGIYPYHTSKQELALLKNLGFNTILPYNSLSMGFSAPPKNYTTSPKGWERAREVFRWCAENEMKIIFSLKDLYPMAGKWAVSSRFGENSPEKIAAKAAEVYRNEPALLAWYTCDELPKQMIPELRQRRELLNAVDPLHPVYAVCAIGYTTDALRPFGSTADVIGPDSYPIHADFNVHKLEKVLASSAETGRPFWPVLQSMNWHRYRPDLKNADSFRFPTASEFRTMILLAAAHNAKGFLFFAAAPLVQPDPKLDGDTKENLETVRSGLAMIKSLEPFVLSDMPPAELKVKNLEGRTRAWRFQDGKGNSRLVFVSFDKGSNQAEISLDGKWKSLYGKTRGEAGKLIFQAAGPDSDLLENME